MSDQPVPSGAVSGQAAVTAVDPSLAPMRQKIDAIDSQLLVLLNERAALAQAIGHVKAQTDAPVMRPEREAQVVARLLSENNGPLPPDAVVQLFREVMSACRSLERRVGVAYLGPQGTYSEQAVWSHFGRFVNALAATSLDEALRSVETGASDFCVLPIENSTEGSVSQTLDLLLQTPLVISGEVSLPIHHQLLTQATSLADVTEVLAHPQALAQCRDWLQRHLPGVRQSAVSSNAEGARLALAQPHAAAIAGQAAQEHYGLPALAQHIQDNAQNRTRFVVLGRLKPGPSGNDRTSLICALPNHPGAVHRMLEPLARHGVSMSRFESRPARTGRWEYYFYMDVLGHQTDAALQQSLAELEAHTSFYKCLGSYPVAPL
jgi:chorismate mutase/prephenate dehydratase